MKKYVREPFPALSHLFGAIISIIALIFLLENSEGNLRATIACVIYGSSLIILYVASALTHGVHGSPRLMSYFERFDHAAIFFLIAGTYTPICLLVIPGPVGLSLFICEWILAIMGIYIIFMRPFITRSLRVWLYVIMGWLFLFALHQIIPAVSNASLVLLLGGGLFYSIGTIFFITDKPNLWPGYFDAHDLWHLFVLGGSTCHFVFISKTLIDLKLFI